jgi:hypothetical protein
LGAIWEGDLLTSTGDGLRLRISGDRDRPAHRAQWPWNRAVMGSTFDGTSQNGWWPARTSIVGEGAANRRQFPWPRPGSVPTDENPLVKTLNPRGQASNRYTTVFAVADPEPIHREAHAPRVLTPSKATRICNKLLDVYM